MNSVRKKIAIVNPTVPHYRKDFFLGIQQAMPCDVFTYEQIGDMKKNQFQVSDTVTCTLKKKRFSKFLIYKTQPLMQADYQTLVLMWDFSQLTTWWLLATKFFHRKRIILWGQGISVKRYLTEENTPNILLKGMLGLADGAWVYMEKEAKQWQAVFPNKKIAALNNTVSNIDEILESPGMQSISDLKNKHNIKEEVCLIFCARFENPNRRIDLLEGLIKSLDAQKFGFIIIGDGVFKPDFSMYKNVYDFGAVYDKVLKDELFGIANLYYQPGWIGLSVVEALAYGKPVITFKRSEETLQCVEYAYIQDGYNGLIVESLDELTGKLLSLNNTAIALMGANAKAYAKKYLRMNHMVDKAIGIL
ncbi:glycosyltransferase [Olivibacter domesticus]|uniref:Glycosyl transferases group 1 n=1 Tax=Olivibacter domesticus TaxID=407022 RepID=A0A1H7UNI8_OLID1|nr:glycosyltransferase [Olivibacter domesticus]SEL98570.1 Glycosyl transferases group 1 [Olivibacter domesticus]